MSDCLFVYGTLMRKASAVSLGRDMREGLEEAATWLGEARLAGRLFDLGSYPVLQPPHSAGDTVHGELWRLRDPDAAFRWLDPYEGIEPGKEDASEFERVLREVVLADGRRLEAWVYVYRDSAAGLRQLPQGRWRPSDG